MSYVFTLVTPPEGTALRTWATRNIDDGTFAPVDLAIERSKLRLAEALVAACPTLEISEVGYERNASSRLRNLELNDLGDDTFGIQINLYDAQASVTLPFWHTGDKAAACLEQAFELINVICNVAGYSIYDVRQGREIAPGEAIDATLACYAAEMKRVSRDPDLGGRKPPKPKWKK